MRRWRGCVPTEGVARAQRGSRNAQGSAPLGRLNREERLFRCRALGVGEDQICD